MVSKARLDLPLPLGPVTTVSWPSGRSRSIPLRLFWRAPRTSTHPRSAGAVTHFRSPFRELTGDYPSGRSDSQISRGENAFFFLLVPARNRPPSAPMKIAGRLCETAYQIGVWHRRPTTRIPVARLVRNQNAPAFAHAAFAAVRARRRRANRKTFCALPVP